LVRIAIHRDEQHCNGERTKVGLRCAQFALARLRKLCDGLAFVVVTGVDEFVQLILCHQRRSDRDQQRRECAGTQRGVENVPTQPHAQVFDDRVGHENFVQNPREERVISRGVQQSGFVRYASCCVFRHQMGEHKPPDVFGRAFRQARDFAPALQDTVELLPDFWGKVEPGLVFTGTLGFVAFAEGGGGCLVVAGHGDEGFLGHTPLYLIAVSKANDGVPTFDMVVEEVERRAGVVGFQPESHLAQFNGQGVLIHAIDALADHVAHGGAEGSGCGLLLAGADDGQLCGNAPSGGEQDVA